MAEMRRIVHIDMDAFYAAIEQRDGPQYRGRPVVVGADPKRGRGRGVVSTASYDAAPLRCTLRYAHLPGLPLMSPRPSFCRSAWRTIIRCPNVFSPFSSATPMPREPLSIDEAFLDVPTPTRLFGTVEEIARASSRIFGEMRVWWPQWAWHPISSWPSWLPI